MRILIAMAAVLCPVHAFQAEAQPPREPNTTTYQVREAGREGNPIAVGELVAREGGKSYTVIGRAEKMCLSSVVVAKDFDGNGFTDALVRTSPACGGNCCGDTYLFVSNTGNGRFKLIDLAPESFSDPEIQWWKGRWSVVITETNSGYNRDPLRIVHRRFVLEQGKANKVEELEKKELPSLLDLRSNAFTKDDEIRSIQFDLDGDGKKDKVIGQLWDRWGVLRLSVEFGNGKKAQVYSECRRIGVLATKTKGVNDLVCEHDDILRWNGVTYISSESKR